MKKIDIILALITGEGVAWLVLGLLKGFKDIEVEAKFLEIILPIFLPILSLVALWIARLIGKKFLFVFQIAKFLLIGILATLFNLVILNFLMWVSGINRGWPYSVFIGIAFILATVAKYWGNKFWAFEKSEMVGVGKEMTQFFVVTLVGLGINVGIASFVVNVIGPQLGASPVTWANIGAIIAAFFAAILNFLGYKFIVFKK